MTTSTKQIPHRVSQWELYRGMKGASEAARKLTSALKRAEKDVRKGLRQARSNQEANTLVGKAFREHVEPVMDAYADQGAADTEPRCVGMAYLGKVVQEYGFFGW